MLNIRFKAWIQFSYNLSNEQCLSTMLVGQFHKVMKEMSFGYDDIPDHQKLQVSNSTQSQAAQSHQPTKLPRF